MTRFFIDRPIFSCVISMVIFLAGFVTFFALPMAQFPDIVPPTVNVTTTYSGADAQTVANTVAVPIESKVNGVDNMLYMSSSSSNNGSLSMTVTFDIGTEPDLAAVNVNNRVQQALPTLPEDVKRVGVVVQKQSTSIVMIVSVFDPLARTNPEQARDDTYLSNYISLKLKDVLARVPGVGLAQVFDGKDYGMRIWLNPQVLAERKISVQDITQIIREQNVQVAAGSIGADPAPEGQQTQIITTTRGRLETVEQFENLVIRSYSDGRILRLKDVGHVELGSQSYGMASTFDGLPASTIGIYQLPGSNAIKVADAIRETLKNLEPEMERDGLKYVIGYDATQFVTASVDEVYETLAIAILLVIFTVYIFLQDWRAALIPTLTIPVSLMGTFALMMLFGFSINTLSLFGIILVIGIVVDDAIVVVEDTQRLIDEEGYSPREAAHHAMQQVSGPVIATALVLMAVFIPTGLMPGIVGRLYAQFALTIAGATAISAVCALTLAPALAAILLRKSGKKRFFVFIWFNRTLDTLTRGYLAGVSKLLRASLFVLLLWGCLVGALYWGGSRLPTGFLPNEDQGVIFADIRLPDGSSLERTQNYAKELAKNVFEKHTDAVDHIMIINGMSLKDGTQSSNVAVAFLPLKHWDERQKPQLKAKAVIASMYREASKFPEGVVFIYGPPPIMGLGSSNGINIQLQDKGNRGNIALYDASNQLRDHVTQESIGNFASAFRPTVPMYHLEIDHDKAKMLGVSMTELNMSLQTYFGATYINDFNRFDRVFKVIVMGEKEYRARQNDLMRIKVRNNDGEMILLSSFMSARKIVGPEVVTRYNMFPSTLITAIPKPGKSSGDGMKDLEEECAALGQGFGFEWTNMSYQEKTAGSSGNIVFVLAIVFAFLVLAAQYESWSAPVIIMMAIPIAIAGALIGITLRGFDFNVYTQVGIVILIGLSAKNSILIVEFARDARRDGKSIFDSAMQAAKLRLRPILMTSFAFILGVNPLVVASGAGAVSRQAIGTTVCCGMLAVTCVGIFVTPTLYLLIQRLSEGFGCHFQAFLGTDTEKKIR